MAGDFGFVPYTGAERFVFISYKSEEQDAAAIYARFLRDNGVNVYYDAALKPSADWAKTLLDTIALPNCAGVVLFASARSVVSQPVIDEVRKAHYSAGKTVLAVYIEQVDDIEEPMRTYLSSTHSVLAWKMSEKQALSETLTGVRLMLAGDKTPPKQTFSTDGAWQHVQFYLTNCRRSRSRDDAEKARGYALQITEHAPLDYRGWLGLALCDVVVPPDGIESAADCLKAAAGHYSYVVSAGEDEKASPMYTMFKSEFWRALLRLMEDELENTDTSALGALSERIAPFASFMGHTDPSIRARYDALVAHIREEQHRRAQEAQNAEKAVFNACEWREISAHEVMLVRYNSDAAQYVIPQTVDGKTVSAIGAGAFAGCGTLTCVTIPDTVKEIADDAFTGCHNLTICSTGGLLSRVRRYAARHGIRYERI